MTVGLCEDRLRASLVNVSCQLPCGSGLSHSRLVLPLAGPAGVAVSQVDPTEPLSLGPPPRCHPRALSILAPLPAPAGPGPRSPTAGAWGEVRTGGPQSLPCHARFFSFSLLPLLLLPPPPPAQHPPGGGGKLGLELKQNTKSEGHFLQSLSPGPRWGLALQSGCPRAPPLPS